MTDVRHHFLEPAGRRLHVLEWPSAGPTIVCQHYMWSVADVWADLHEALGGRFRVLSIDSPGHGGSEARDPDDVIEVVEAVVDALTDGPSIHLGASNGARRSAFFAIARPERVRRLVMVETPVLASTDTRNVERERVAKLPSEPRSLDELVEAYQQTIFRHGRPELVRTLLARTWAFDGERWRQRLSIDEIPTMRTPFELTLDAFSGLTMPVLIVYAEASKLCGASGARQMADRIRDCRIVGLPECGHVVHVNQPERLHAAIAGFCAPELVVAARPGA